LREDVWLSSFDDRLGAISISDAKPLPGGAGPAAKVGGITAQAISFANKATALLKKHNNKLPAKYRCSDHRHKLMYQKKLGITRGQRMYQRRQSKSCPHSVTKGWCKKGHKQFGWMRLNCPAQCKGGPLPICVTHSCAKTKDATLARFAIFNF